MGLFSRIEALLYPPRCLFCGEVVRFGLICCDSCDRAMTRLPESAAKQCYPGMKACTSPFLYEGTVRESLIRMKDVQHKGYSQYFARYCAEAVRRDFRGAGIAAVVCVPNWEPDGKRVYNQARVLSRALASELSLPFYAEALFQTREKIRKQHELDAKGREANVKGLYRAVPETVRGKTLLLADDITTTGSTLTECCGALHEAGAGEIYCVTAAKTISKTK